MKLDTLLYSKGRWSGPMPSALDSERTIVFAFGAPAYRGAAGPLLELRAALPSAHIVGCSTAGEILDERIHDDSIVAAVARFDGVTSRVATAAIGRGAASRAAGEALGRALDGPGLRAVIAFGEGLDVNASELVRGINAVIPSPVVVTGGLAADGPRFEHTWTFDGSTVAEGRVVALGLYGDALRVSHGSRGGWDIFGPERRVTRSEGNVLFELDGKPALKLYKEYLGERAAGLPATALLFPLALRAAGDQDKQLVRTILAVDEASQSLTFAGDVPEGSMAQLMRANFDRLIDGASSAAACARGDGSPVLAIAVSCVGRRLVLGQRCEEEVEATLEALPSGSTQVGFYSYGELAPHTSGACDLHNQTMTLTTLFEV